MQCYLQKSESMRFHERCGNSIKFSKSKDCAERKEGYDNGIVFSCKPLKKSQIFEVKINAIEEKWAGSIVSVCLLNHMVKKWEKICPIFVEHFF